MDEAHETIEYVVRWLDATRMNLRMIKRGKHVHSASRLQGVVRELRTLADKLEPHIAALED